MAGARQLRPYQAEAVEAVEADWARGINRTSVVMATGLGKSTVIGEIAVRAYRQGRPVALLAHRAELCDQMLNTVLQLDLGIPLDHVGTVRASQNDCHAPIVAATLQTLRSPRRLYDLGPRPVVLLDEAHHGAATGYYKTLGDLGVFTGGYLCGFTATMRRDDKGTIGLADLFDNVAFERDIEWAIENGYLVSPRGLTVHTDELNALETARTVAGDYDKKQLAEIMEAAADCVATAVFEHARDRRSIIFAASVDAAQAMADMLTALGHPTGVITGKMSYEARQPVYEAFRTGALRAMTTVGVLTEGADFPMCDCVVLARPTKSMNLYCYDAETEILTPNGWRLGTEVSEGDIVAAFDTATGEVRWERAVAYINRVVEPDERMVSISSPTTDLRVTGNHRMVWRSSKRHEWRIDEAIKLAGRRTGFRLPAAGIQKSAGIELTDDELSFIGWVETDGCINRATGAVQISQQYPENCIEIERVLTGCGFKWRVSESTADTEYGQRKYPLRVYRVSQGKPRGEDVHLRGWGSLAPWIPKAVGGSAYTLLDDMDAEQWRVFLNAVHLGDGSKQAGQTWTRRGYHIASVRQDFADWAQSMCVRRGWRANVTHEVREAGRDIFWLHCRELAERTVGGAGQSDRQHMQVSNPIQGERVWCVQVPSGAVMVRRRGKALVSGNCQMIGRAIRLHPGKDDALVLDLAGAGRQVLCLTDLVEGVEARDVAEDGHDMGGEIAEQKPKALAFEKPVRSGAVTLREFELLPKRGRGKYRRTAGGYIFAAAKQDRCIVFLAQAGLGWRVGYANTRSGEVRLADVVLRSFEEADGLAKVVAEHGFGGMRTRNRSDRPATPKQINFAEGAGIEGAADMTVGELSEALDVNLASRVLDARVPKLAFKARKAS